MNRFTNILVSIVIIVALLVVSGAFYTVDETQQVVVTQFGKLVGKPKTKAGLYFKIPFIQVANYFDKRILEWDGDPNEIPTKEKRNIYIDTIAKWRIKDPLKFMRSVRTEASAQTRLDDIIDAKTREVISSHNFAEIIRDTNRLVSEQDSYDDVSKKRDHSIGKIMLKPIKYGREKLTREILKRAASVALSYGIEIVDVRIKRINYIQKVQEKVYERMISERKRAAEQFRSEGYGKKAEIEGQMAKDLEKIRAEAYRKAQEIRGKADAEAIKIYADAYNKDPEFFSFVRTLESYKNAINKDTTLILSTENEFYRLLNSSTHIKQEDKH